MGIDPERVGQTAVMWATLSGSDRAEKPIPKVRGYRRDPGLWWVTPLASVYLADDNRVA